MSYLLDGFSYPFSDYGRVKLTYTGDAQILFFNFDINGRWEVRNMPVLSEQGPGSSNTVGFSFDLGVPDGTQVVVPVGYGWTLTPTPLGDPGVTGTTTVAQDFSEIHSGASDAPFDGMFEGATGGPVDGGGAVAANTATRKDFPNQPCGHNECAPTAISNSLKWLNTTYNLGINPNDLSIANMKTATGWTNNGCPIFGSGAFWRQKDAYVKGKGWKISTTTSSDWNVILDQFKKGQDIELEMKGHTAAIVGSPGTELEFAL